MSRPYVHACRICMGKPAAVIWGVWPIFLAATLSCALSRTPPGACALPAFGIGAVGVKKQIICMQCAFAARLIVVLTLS